MREDETPVTVMGYDPVRVDDEAVSVSVDAQAGAQEMGEKDEDTPAGRADVENDTD